MGIRMDIQAEERAQTERIELERLQLRRGMGVPVEQRAQQPGTFFVGLGKPATKLFVRKRQFTSWAVTNSCDDARLETTNPILFEGPNAVSRKELVFHHGQAREASARMVHEGITSAVRNLFLLGKIYELGSPSLAMAEVRRMYVSSNDLDKQSSEGVH